MLRFLKELGKAKWLLPVLATFVISQVVIDCIMPIYMGNIIKLINVTDVAPDMQKILFSSLIMIGAALASGVVSIIISALASHITSVMMSSTRDKIYNKLVSFSSYEISKYDATTLITRATNDISNITKTYVFSFRFMFYSPLMIIAAFIALMLNGFQYKIALLLVLSFAALGLIIFFLVRFAMPHYHVIQTRIDGVSNIAKESLDGLRVIRAYNAESYQANKFTDVNNSLTYDERVSSRAIGFFSPIVQLAFGLIMVGITMISSHAIKNNEFDYPTMTVIIQFSSMLLGGIIYTVYILVQMPRAEISAKRIFEIIDTDVKMKFTQNTIKSKEKGSIEFKNVSFTYPGGGAPSVKNINFKVAKGKTLAFIGSTGAGKTTILNLIMRFYDPSTGEVLVDGINVKEYEQHQLFAKFGYVPQKPYLFHDTLRNNVCLGNIQATDKDLKEALDISQSSEFVKKLDKGVEYQISQGGKNVSGGQRQRLSIARAIIVKPEFFIFDDSFSALDYRTDKAVRKQIKTRCKGTTNIIVAQRVGTIMDADEIVVLDNGDIVGRGTHRELLKKCKVYREIALSQLSKEELV